MSINDWKAAACETREAYEHSEDIAFDPEREATTAYIASLEALCSAYEVERAGSRGPSERELRLEKALNAVLDEVGSSTKANKIAIEVLSDAG